MKKLLFIFMSSALVLASCGGSDDGGSEGDESKGGDGTETSDADFSDMKEVALDTFGIAMKIRVPEYDGPMNTTLAHNLEEVDEGFRWRISIGEEGEKYALFIEDIKGFEDEHTIEGKKKELGSYKFMTVSYPVDEPDLIMYETVYPGDETIDPHFHVMGIIQTEQGPFKVYSDETVMFNKRKADKMLLSVRSLMQKAA